MKINDILTRLKNPVVLMGTATNIWVLLETIDVLNFCGVTENDYMKVVGVVIALLLEIGILANPVSEKNTNEFDNLK